MLVKTELFSAPFPFPSGGFTLTNSYAGVKRPKLNRKFNFLQFYILPSWTCRLGHIGGGHGLYLGSFTTEINRVNTNNNPLILSSLLSDPEKHKPLGVEDKLRRPYLSTSLSSPTPRNNPARRRPIKHDSWVGCDLGLLTAV